MQAVPLSESESLRLTNSVVKYQSNRSNNALYRWVHQKTQTLLYTLPSHLHLLDEEDCCEFLFFCYDAIDYYLLKYREGRLSYQGYLIQVVRKRSRYFIAQQKSHQKNEQLLLESEHYQQETETMDSVAAEEAGYTAFSKLPMEELEQLPALYEQLLIQSPSTTQPTNVHLAHLQEELRKPVNRKRFLIVLTLSPDLAGQYLLEDLAILLAVDPILLNRYLTTATRMLEQKQHCKELFETVSHRHFRRLLEIEAQLQREEDPAKKMKLEALREWTQRVYKAKVEQIRTMEYHLSHSQVGALLQVPKGTIDSSVHYMKRLLSRCMDEMRDNEYL